jgi:hypothetical protein
VTYVVAVDRADAGAAFDVVLPAQPAERVGHNHLTVRPHRAASVSTAFDLTRHTIAGGTTAGGTVQVDNPTSRPIEATTCGGLFFVALANHRVAQDPVQPTCAQDFVIPPGQSSYPVAAYASYDGCGPTATAFSPACDANGNVPSLPPGRYVASVRQQSPVVPDPPPITVTITAP